MASTATTTVVEDITALAYGVTIGHSRHQVTRSGMPVRIPAVMLSILGVKDAQVGEEGRGKWGASPAGGDDSLPVFFMLK